MTSTTERVASVGTVTVRETFYRHAAPNRDAFIGGHGGRWGATFPVIYLGRPTDSVVIEAYRHLVDDAGVPAKNVKGRVLYTVPVLVTRVLDLTDPQVRDALGVEETLLRSPVGEYSESQELAAAAHQLRLHGILAPAAQGVGETLALFRERLPAAEVPVPSSQEVWQELPADPRRLRRLEAHA